MTLTIIGASGHGKVVADAATYCGYDNIVFLDDDETSLKCGKWPVVGKTNKAAEVDNDLFIAIGDAKTRKRFFELYSNKHIVTIIHPAAVIAEDVSIDAGTVVMPGAVINPGVIIGKGCIINTSSSVDHDCFLEDYVHVSVGAHLSGTVHVGELTWIGAGATVSNNINICSGCMIGAGAVVVKSIEEAGKYIGVPAKRVVA
ncbi:MAG: acetyltransferase [Clostridiales bacterium]|nr:acetyltransferase [Clostridiales bacterium]